jgi:tetratricopeptide (TPR) repeat protein
MWRTLFTIGIGLLLPALGHAISPYEAVQQGNTLYQAGQYTEAEQQYELAGQALPEAAEIHFNQGNTFYKQQDYTKALEHYTQALRTADRQLEGKVKYNFGNTAYQQALQAMQKPGEVTTYLQTAMKYYRDSLEVDPHWDHYNLSSPSVYSSSATGSSRRNSQNRTAHQQQHQQQQHAVGTNRTKHRPEQQRRGRTNSKISRASGPSHRRMPSRPPRAIRSGVCSTSALRADATGSRRAGIASRRRRTSARRHP